MFVSIFLNCLILIVKYNEQIKSSKLNIQKSKLWNIQNTLIINECINCNNRAYNLTNITQMKIAEMKIKPFFCFNRDNNII